MTATMDSDFSGFVDSYRSIIDEVSRPSGERYDFFVRLRAELIARELRLRHGGGLSGTLLDFGCGVGDAEAILAACFPRVRIVGADTSAASIARAQKGGGDRVRFAVIANDRIGLESGEADLVYSNGTFHHIPEDQRLACLRELHRVLRSGGDAFVFENNPLNPFMTRAMRRNPMDEGVAAVPPSGLARRAAHAGFLVSPARYYFFFPHLLRALRPLETLLRRVPLGAQYYLRMHKP
jgi:SAM-dependent methyltransferase